MPGETNFLSDRQTQKVLWAHGNGLQTEPKQVPLVKISSGKQKAAMWNFSSYQGKLCLSHRKTLLKSTDSSAKARDSF
jgi:hypothetical protein